MANGYTMIPIGTVQTRITKTKQLIYTEGPIYSKCRYRAYVFCFSCYEDVVRQMLLNQRHLCYEQVSSLHWWTQSSPSIV